MSFKLCRHCHVRRATQDGLCERCYTDGEGYLFLRARGHSQRCAVAMQWRGEPCTCSVAHPDRDPDPEPDDAPLSGRHA